MKRYLLTLILAVACMTARSADDDKPISIVAYVAPSSDYSRSIQKTLTSKLNALLSASGIERGAGSSSFVITAFPNVIDKNITGSAPPMVALNVDLEISIGNIYTQSIIGTTVVSLKGVGSNETKAYQAAIKRLSSRNEDVKDLIVSAEEQIKSYYVDNCDAIVKKAEALASQDREEEAISMLMEIPSSAEECYDKALEASSEIYSSYVNKDCKALLGKAKSKWNSSQTLDGAEDVSEILAKIKPQADCYDDAMKFSEEVAVKVKELSDRDWDFEMKAYDDQVDLAEQEIKAMKDVGVAYGKNQPKEKMVEKTEFMQGDK